MAEQHAAAERTGPPTLMQVCDDIRKEWLSRAKSESDLTAELMTNITAAPTLPDTTAACGAWVTRRMEMVAEDNRRFWADVRSIGQSLAGMTDLAIAYGVMHIPEAVGSMFPEPILAEPVPRPSISRQSGERTAPSLPEVMRVNLEPEAPLVRTQNRPKLEPIAA